MKQIIEHDTEDSFIIPLFSRFVEWGNKHLTVSRLFSQNNKRVFVKLEVVMIVITLICLGILFTVQFYPYWLCIIIFILLIQRILEFFIVYSRNFIFNRGRIFSNVHFDNPQKRGEWLITMFGLNVVQIVLIFAIWFQIISRFNSEAFSKPLFILDSLYFSVVTFVTVGYGDIFPISSFAKIIVISQIALTFYIIVIVINGLISMHFKNNK